MNFRLGKIIKKIDRKKGAKYNISENGLIVETITSAEAIDQIEIKDNCKYVVDLEGNVREIELVKVSISEFYKMKEDGRLKEIYKQGKDVEIIEPKVDFFNLKGRTIVDVREHQLGRYVLEFDNGKKIIVEGVEL